LPWVSAVVAHDDTSITVATGIDRAGCKELSHPQATVRHQDDNQVVISVTASVVHADDCSAAGRAVFASVSLQRPLGDRVLRDAATSRQHPTYFRSNVPDPPPNSQWGSVGHLWTDDSWYQSFQDGPGGAEAHLQALPTAKAHPRPATIAAIPIGSRQGTITTNAASQWVLWWEVKQVTYSLTLTPPAGRHLTLDEFKQQIARFKWS
jgi:hypothetical protein